MKLENIRIDRTRPNYWNPNMMTQKTERALSESLSAFGFINPITVRRVEEEDFDFEIVDGEHRFEHARQRKHKTIPATVLDLDDTKAKKLTIILNELKGKPETVPLAELLKDIQESSENSLEEYTFALPFNQIEVEELLDKASRMAEDLTLHEVSASPQRLILKIPSKGGAEIKERLLKWVKLNCPEIIIVS